MQLIHHNTELRYYLSEIKNNETYAQCLNHMLRRYLAHIEEDKRQLREKNADYKAAERYERELDLVYTDTILSKKATLFELEEYSRSSKEKLESMDYCLEEKRLLVKTNQIRHGNIMEREEKRLKLAKAIQDLAPSKIGQLQKQ